MRERIAGKNGYVLGLGLIVAACAVGGPRDPCAFDLRSNGWNRVEPYSNEHIALMSESEDWFVNLNGDYLICHNTNWGGACGGIYELFTRKSDTEFSRQEVVCTR